MCRTISIYTFTLIKFCCIRFCIVRCLDEDLLVLYVWLFGFVISPTHLPLVFLCFCLDVVASQENIKIKTTHTSARQRILETFNKI